MRKILKTLLLVVAIACFACFFAVGCGRTETLQITVDNAAEGVVAVDYDGTPQAITLSGVPEDVTVTVLYEGEAYPSSETAPTESGEYTVTVKTNKTKKYKAFELEVKLIIGRIQNTFEFNCPDFYVGDEIVPVVTKNASGGAVTYKYKGRDGTTYEESATAPTEIGAYTVTATVAGTTSYYGAQKTANFEIHSTDPLYGVPDENKATVENLTRYENVTLGKGSWNTNRKSTLLKNGLLKVNDEYFMLNVPIEDDGMIYLLVNSSVKTTAYFRFTIEDKYNYKDIVENGSEYCKAYSEIAVNEGYQLLAVPTTNTAGFTGDKEAPITGFHTMFAADEIEFTVHGVYYKNLSLSAVPTEITEQVEGKVKLNTELAPASYATNTSVVAENGVVDASKCGLSIKVNGIQDKVYLIVYSAVAQSLTLRAGVKTGWGYTAMVEQPDANVKFHNVIAVEKGYSLLEVNLTKWGGSVSDHEPVTSLFFWGTGMLESGITVYGVYVDEFTGIPDSVMIQTEGKQKLEPTLSAASDNVNEAEKVTLNEGVIACNGSLLSLNVTGIANNKVYFVVNAAEEVEFDLYAFIEGGGTYANAVTGAATYSPYKNTVTFDKGWSFVEVELTAFDGYTGSADAAIAGLFFDKEGGFTDGFEIHGVYTDIVIPESVPQEILDKVAEKQKLELALAPASYSTNDPAKVTIDEDGIITAKGNFVAIDITAQKFTKVYVIIKAEAAVNFSLYSLIENGNTYDAAKNHRDDHCKYMNEALSLSKGYQLLEITLMSYYGLHTNEDICCLYFLDNTFEGGIEIHGIYIDKPVVVEPDEGVPQDILDKVADKQKLEPTLAPASYITNGAAANIDSETGVITVQGALLSVDVTGITDKIYVIVKAPKAYTMRLYSFSEGGNLYTTVINAPGDYCVHFNEGIAIAEGYQLLEITLNPYNGGANLDKEIFGLYFWEGTCFADGIEIHGIYVDKAEVMEPENPGTETPEPEPSEPEENE